MTLMSMACLIAAGVMAVADWCLTPRDWGTWRWVTKGSVPAFLTASIVLTGLTLPHPAWAATLVAGALCMCLLGDLILMEPGRFVYGAVAFGAAQAVLMVTLTWRVLAGPVASDQPRGVVPAGWIAFGVAGALMVAGFLTIGLRLIKAAHRDHLGTAVTLYIVLISAMLLSASLHAGHPWGWWPIAAAALFYVSDAMLGWRQFVRRSAAGAIWIMVTYHLALFGFTAWALAQATA